MSADPFHLNRPVHLARRDAFFEGAVKRLRQLPSFKCPFEQRKQAEQALYLLRESRRHAEAANLSEQTPEKGLLFIEFMNATIDNTQSIARMLRRQLSVTTPNNPTDRFLGSRDATTKMDGHYRRCAAHILKGLLNVLQQAEKPFHELHHFCYSELSQTDQARYDKARAHFEKQVDKEAEKAVECLPDIQRPPEDNST